MQAAPATRFSEAFEAAALDHLCAAYHRQLAMVEQLGPHPIRLVAADVAEVGPLGSRSVERAATESRAGLYWHPPQAAGGLLARLEAEVSSRAIPELVGHRVVAADRQIHELMLVAAGLSGASAYFGHDGHWFLVRGPLVPIRALSVERVHQVLNYVVVLRARAPGWLPMMRGYLEACGFTERRRGRELRFVHAELGTVVAGLDERDRMIELSSRALREDLH